MSVSLPNPFQVYNVHSCSTESLQFIGRVSVGRFFVVRHESQTCVQTDRLQVWTLEERRGTATEETLRLPTPNSKKEVDVSRATLNKVPRAPSVKNSLSHCPLNQITNFVLHVCSRAKLHDLLFETALTFPFSDVLRTQPQFTRSVPRLPFSAASSLTPF